MPFGFPDTFEVSPWSIADATASVSVPYIWQHDNNLKKRFAIELGKGFDAFTAACRVLPETHKALWASQNWINDPIVTEIKKVTSEQEEKLLDKSELARKLLRFADEKNFDGTRYVSEPKDRLAALALYAKVLGFVDKQEAPVFNNNLTANVMKIELVEAETTPTIIDNDNQEPIEDDLSRSPIKIQLVG